jgi:hypothetical protein
MTDLRMSQPDLPPIVGDTIVHLRQGFDYLGGEISHAMALIDCGEPGMAYETLAEALRILDREMARH